MVQRGIRPDIPDTVNPVVRDIITRGSAATPVDSPSFDDILTQLTNIQFRILPDVEWDRVASFVDEWNCRRSIRSKDRRRASWEKRECLFREAPFEFTEFDSMKIMSLNVSEGTQNFL
jgi:hypothetical protein